MPGTECCSCHIKAGALWQKSLHPDREWFKNTFPKLTHQSKTTSVSLEAIGPRLKLENHTTSVSLAHVPLIQFAATLLWSCGARIKKPRD